MCLTGHDTPHLRISQKYCRRFKDVSNLSDEAQARKLQSVSLTLSAGAIKSCEKLLRVSYAPHFFAWPIMRCHP